MTGAVKMMWLWRNLSNKLAWEVVSSLYVADTFDESRGCQTCTSRDLRNRARVLARRAMAAQDRSHEAQERAQIERRAARPTELQAEGDDGNP